MHQGFDYWLMIKEATGVCYGRGPGEEPDCGGG